MLIVPQTRVQSRLVRTGRRSSLGGTLVALTLPDNEGLGRLRVLMFFVCLGAPANGCRQIEPGPVRDGLHAAVSALLSRVIRGKSPTLVVESVRDRASRRSVLLGARRHLTSWATERVQVSPCGC